MAARSTTSANEPPPPFYGQHTTGSPRNVHRAAAVPPLPPGAVLNPQPTDIHVTAGRRIDTVYFSGTSVVNPQVIDAAHVHLVSLSIAPPGL